MRLHEEFTVDQPVVAVWQFLEQPEMVARCMPGVEQIRVVDPDHVDVRATQGIGPMTATFEAKVTVLERVEHELIRFQATGKSVRGATGNVRSRQRRDAPPGRGRHRGDRRRRGGARRGPRQRGPEDRGQTGQQGDELRSPRTCSWP